MPPSIRPRKPQSKSASKKRQTTLNFSTIAPSSPSIDDAARSPKSLTTIPIVASVPQNPPSFGSLRSSQHPAAVDDSSGDEDPIQLPGRRRTAGVFAAEFVEGDSDAILVPNARRRKRLESSEEDMPTSNISKESTMMPRPRNKRVSINKGIVLETTSEDEDEVITSRRRSVNRTPLQEPALFGSARRSVKIRKDDENVYESDGDLDIQDHTSEEGPTKHRRNLNSRTPRQKPGSLGSITRFSMRMQKNGENEEDSDGLDIIEPTSEDEDGVSTNHPQRVNGRSPRRISTPLKTTARGSTKIQDSENEVDSDDNPGIMPRGIDMCKADEEEGEEEKEADELNSDYELALKTPIVKSKTRYAGSSKKQTPFQRRLEILKAKREGKAISESRQSSVSNNSFLDGEDSDGDEDEDEVDKSQNLNSDLEGFIVDDNPEDLLGAPDNVAMPLEFTAAAHQSVSTNFRVFCTWLIHYILLPDLFPPSDEVVQNALRRLDTATSGFGDSVLASGAWKPEYIRALKSRPNLKIKSCLGSNHCDACNRSDRLTKHRVRLYGRLYDKHTLEDLPSDKEENEVIEDPGGNITAKDEHFMLGSMCYYRTRSAHALFHWKKELRNWLIKQLIRKGYSDQDGNLEIDGVDDMDDEEKREWAISISNGMGSIIDALYHDYKETTGGIRDGMGAGKWGFGKGVRTLQGWNDT